MWQTILGYLPTFKDWCYIILSFIVPFTVYKANKMLHNEMDPPWKQEENAQQQKKQPSN